MNIYSKKIHKLLNTKKHQENQEILDLCKEITLVNLIRLMPRGDHNVALNCWLNVRITKTEVAITSTSGKDESNPSLYLPASIIVDQKGIKSAFKNISNYTTVYNREDGRSKENLDNRHAYRDVKKAIRDAIISGAKDLIKKEELVKAQEEALKLKAEE